VGSWVLGVGLGGVLRGMCFFGLDGVVCYGNVGFGGSCGFFCVFLVQVVAFFGGFSLELGGWLWGVVWGGSLTCPIDRSLFGICSSSGERARVVSVVSHGWGPMGVDIYLVRLVGSRGRAWLSLRCLSGSYAAFLACRYLVLVSLVAVSVCFFWVGRSLRWLSRCV